MNLCLVLAAEKKRNNKKPTHTSSVFQSLAAAVLIIPNLDYKITVKFKYIEKNYDNYYE